MSITFSRVKSGISDFTKGVKILAKGTRNSDAVGDKKLAYMSRIVQGQIDISGKQAVRTQVIKSIEGDFKRAAKKGSEEVEKMIQNALATPDYIKLLHRLDLEEPHLRVMAMQAMKNVNHNQKPKAKRRTK